MQFIRERNGKNKPLEESSANVFKMTLDQIVGQNGNKEFTDLVTVLGCNVGSKFDIDKLNYDKIIIATDADVDGLWIRSLLLAFFFKVFPEIVAAGKVFIAEPPLYRVADKKNPFVKNTQDYLSRYVIQASKDYKLGYKKKEESLDTEWLDKSSWTSFLDDSKKYVEEIQSLVKHYKVNDRLIEIVLEELTNIGYDDNVANMMKKLDVNHLMYRVSGEFNELYYDEKDQLIRGAINTVWQELEISDAFIHKSKPLIDVMSKWMAPENGCIVLRNIKTGTEDHLSLLGALKILQKYKPTIEHRFKGLGENDAEDIRLTVMDPNTRTLIRVTIGDYENDMKIFQILRGGSPSEMAERHKWIQAYHIDKDLIDT